MSFSPRVIALLGFGEAGTAIARGLASESGWRGPSRPGDNAPRRVIAIDMHGMEPIASVTIFKKDFLEEDAPALLIEALGGEKADCVLSDMAAHATGHRQTDHINIMALAEAGYEFAKEVLKPGGTYLAKVLRGGTEGDMLKMMKKDFASVRHVKPMASRDDSAELFVLAMGFRGDAAKPAQDKE